MIKQDILKISYSYYTGKLLGNVTIHCAALLTHIKVLNLKMKTVLFYLHVVAVQLMHFKGAQVHLLLS